MPLVRVQVRNEYRLGKPELFREADREDPEAVLHGVAVAGLVGILRQLGDLAEFAAEVFHGLQEQVMYTSSKSHKLMVRLQHMESALPPLEKVILAQKSHLHFAYTIGSVWHPRLQNEQNHFIVGDLPQFIMDSYEECRGPPRLQLLDKFDTGGPGSCLKRYSDPTFFRRASASSGEANIERVTKTRKVRRRKKNRTWERNGASSHGASLSNHSNRMQFASRKDDEHASTSQSVSAFGTFDESNSFDSRTGSSYIECEFHPAYSKGHDENEPKESSFSRLKMNHEDTIYSSSVDEHSRVVDDDIPHSLSPEQTCPRLSCVTWDEKTEIVEIAESGGHQSDHDEITEMLQEKAPVIFRSVDQMNIQLNNETPISVSNWNQIDDIESEAENYVDALNTIESESETELNFQTKREVEKSFIFIDEETNDGTDGVIAHHSDLQPSNLQSCNGKPYDMDESLAIDLCESSGILDGSNVESAVSDSQHSAFTEPNLKVPMSDKITSMSCKSHKSPAEHCGVQPVMFWTNGSLLGLQPSKPPDFSVLNSVVQDSVTGSKDNLDSPSLSAVRNSEVEWAQSSEAVERISSKSSTSCHNEKNGADLRFFPTENDDCRPNLSESSAVVPENEQAVTPDVNPVSCTEVGENGSPTFGLGNRLLANDFRRKVSLVDGEKSETPSSLKTGVFEQKSRNQTFSPSSSPPLQHIKLSFHPASAFERSKLKLKFPDGSFCHDGSRDLLPAFQLVPDLSARHDIDSDSDNTFCRSSPYMSDDCLSHHSDSNSEEWESDDTPPIKNIDRTRHGSFRIDPVCMCPNVETCLKPCQSGRTLDLPSLSTLNPLFEQEMKICSDGKDFLTLHFTKEPTPLPPPLPPLEWRTMKSDSDVTIGKLDCVSETHNHAFERTSLGSTISPQFKPSQSKQHQSSDDTNAFTPKSKREWQKEVNQARNGKDIDEKDNFLHQIRSKSSRLRHTTTDKPTVIPGPAANVKVTAILEKANAIRQAVGSDDGDEDDNWSDT